MFLIGVDKDGDGDGDGVRGKGIDVRITGKMQSDNNPILACCHIRSLLRYRSIIYYSIKGYNYTKKTIQKEYLRRHDKADYYLVIYEKEPFYF